MKMEHNKLEKENRNLLLEKMGSVVEKKILILLLFFFLSFHSKNRQITEWNRN